MHIREFDGGRGIDIEVAAEFVIVEAGEHAYAIDRGIFMHAIKRVMGIAFVVMEHPAVEVA